MITVYGQAPSRAMRVLWMLEEMGLAYKVRPVDFPNRLKDEEFMSFNPAGSFPAFVDGDVVIADSTAITVYLAEKYGPTSMTVSPTDSNYPTYLQFLHFPESSLGGLLGGSIASRYFAPEEHRSNWAGAFCLDTATRRTALITRQLQRTEFVAGDRFTLADIATAYVLSMWDLLDAADRLSPEIQAYMARMKARPAYQRALAA